ncbi:MAG: phage baseplate assembly protein V [Oscillospiraceae bacterium]|jgi:uncharacterized protein involved in type VI secretion and phage assembly|nr:phage baseplate assembly protein V [Oscillospiraceae bacterium]
MSIIGTFAEIASKSQRKNEIGNTLIHCPTLAVVLEIGKGENCGKVRVRFVNWGKDNSYWVRVLTRYAGKGWGLFWLPEIDDLVLVEFVDGDVDNAYVVGSVFRDDANLPTEHANEDNDQKVLVTKGNNKILIIDAQDKQSFEVQTANGLCFRMNDEKSEISCGDKENKNFLCFNTKNGTCNINVEDKMNVKVGDVEVTLDGKNGKITINCTDVSVKADQSITKETNSYKLKSSNVNIKASGALSASSDGAATIKGQVVKVN